MPDTDRETLQNQGRVIAGALLVVGTSFLYTMETWWLGWSLPLRYLAVYALTGLTITFIASRNVGFRQEEEQQRQNDLWRVAAPFGESLLQSFVVGYLVSLAFAVIDVGDSLITIVRLGLIQVVPLGFGASIANQLFDPAKDTQVESDFPRNLAMFALGTVFVVLPLAPTRVVELLGLQTGWARSEALVSFGHFAGTPAEWVQQTIVLSFPSAVGASAEEVVD